MGVAVPPMIPHASGALWLPEHRTAVIADLHLGYGWAQRRRGELGPVSDGGLLESLKSALDDLKPDRVVLLGDVYHAPRPSAAERALVEEGLAQIRCELVVVRGNHDRAILRDFGQVAVQEWHLPGIVAVHGDAIPETSDYLLLGHFHPCARVRDAAGAARRLRCFVMGKSACILPAFSPFAAGMPWRSIPAKTGGKPRIFLVTGRRVVELPGKPPPATGSPTSSPE